jgi:serine/threonine protein kinase/tetratricopeptide (TPR) repeat protein
LVSDDPAGLCPQCLILGAFESSIGADESGTQTIDTATAEAGDDDFGRYRILRPLGEGGMGTVYLAEQLEPIRRSVALKVVKIGMDTAQVLARFNNERQALAMMDHPNIAQIFDAGATAKGRPYFVMEYIEGAPITQYCDRKRMTTKDRLGLFLVVCRAVQHAHQKGVIHRDLKPSNVLVSEQDGAPVPKVIDFGIAKATDKLAIENTLLTQFGQIVGTPEYASPEQADTMTGQIDEASDVYSLGVLLYELLIGAVPFDTATLRNAGLAEMLRMMREDEAPSLSRKLTSMGAAASDIAARRQTDPASLRRLVDGDLNSITMKALEKARERRYVSVSDLAADIQRHMEHRPVLASPPGRLYRARKFLRRHRLGALGTAAGVAFLVLSGVTAWSLSHFAPRPKLTDKDTIVLADFDNKTGDPVFDDSLRLGLAAELEQSPFLSLISDQRIRKTLALMKRSPDVKLTPEIAQEVCARTDGAAVLDGSLAAVGRQYVLGFRAKNCRNGDILDEEQVQVAKKEEVLNALSQIAGRFRRRVGESLALVKEHEIPLIEATTASLEALQAFSAAQAVNVSRGSAAAIPLFKRAVELDPSFALASAYLGSAYSIVGESVLAVDSLKKAYSMRNHASDPEKLFISLTYEQSVTGNLEKADQIGELWAQSYPRDVRAHSLWSVVLRGAGRHDKSLEEASKAITIDPDFLFGYISQARSYLILDRLEEAGKTFLAASDRKLDAANLLLLRYYVAFLRRDAAAMERQVTVARDRPDSEDWMTHSQALVAAYSGRLQLARSLSRRAVDLARQSGQHERAATFEGAAALYESLLGSAAEAKARAKAALDLSRGREVEYAVAFALARPGSSEQSQKLASDLNRRFPEDTLVQFQYLPVLRALAALQEGRPAQALQELQSAEHYELAMNVRSLNLDPTGAMYPVYVRGEAFLAQNKGVEAAAEFQKLIDHRGIVLADPAAGLARLEIGRAWHLAGDDAKAKAAYQDFLALWKNADEIPILKSAKAEYGRL